MSDFHGDILTIPLDKLLPITTTTKCINGEMVTTHELHNFTETVVDGRVAKRVHSDGRKVLFENNTRENAASGRYYTITKRTTHHGKTTTDEHITCIGYTSVVTYTYNDVMFARESSSTIWSLRQDGEATKMSPTYMIRSDGEVKKMSPSRIVYNSHTKALEKALEKAHREKKIEEIAKKLAALRARM